MKEKITIYTSKTCAYCDQVKSKLKESSIKFIEKDIVESKEKWEEVYNLTGMPTTPTIEINGEFLVPGRDFQHPEHLTEILPNFKKSKHDDNRRILESFRTLNFNIFTAFQRVQQALQIIENNTKKEENVDKSTSQIRDTRNGSKF